MANTYKYYSNKECKYFPCHVKPDENEFNCLFCYCPLYLLGEKCGGNYKYSGPKKIKSCTDCHLPHMPDYYDAVNAKLKEAASGTHV